MQTQSLRNDLASKAYVDSVASGIDWQCPAVCASTGWLTLFGLQLPVDGLRVSAGDRVLALGQDEAWENGLYIALRGGWEKIKCTAGMAVFVTGGTLNQDTGFVLADDATNEWCSFTGVGQITVGVDGQAVQHPGHSPRNADHPRKRMWSGPWVHGDGSRWAEI